jgi:hypothetical protein
VQYDNGIDNDYSCQVFSPPTTRLVGTLSVGQRVTASFAAWATGARYTYQWYRSGVAISGATSSYHTLNSYDAGKTLTVHITGRASGYTTRTVTAGPTATVNKTLSTVTPKISGTKAVGRTLTAARGTWKPGTIAYSYRWSRAGVPISGATGKTYLLTSADAGHGITVSVTGSRKGYTTATRTSSSVTIPAS